MRLAKHRGFTLLELVISCAILVSIFAIAATALTRIHRLRADSESQTRLMTEGRALLDDLASHFAHVAGTNLWISDDGSESDGDGLSIALIRYAVHPQSRKNGDAYDTTPYYSMRIDMARRSADGNGSSVERMARSVTPDDSLLYSNAQAQVTYDTVRRGSSSVTNAYAADEMGTHIPSAAKGDTISVPVTTGSSATTYGTRTSYAGDVYVFPSPFDGTNTVAANVSFENAHSAERILTFRKPVAGRWPEPSTRTVRFRSTAEITAENISSNAFMTPGYLEYTNLPYSSIVFLDAETNANAKTMLEVWTDAYDSLPPPAYTNTNDVAVATVSNGVERVPYPDAPYASSTNGLVSGELVYGPSEELLAIQDFWTWGAPKTMNTNGIISGVSLVVNGRTNTYASAADVANSATSTVTHADASFELAEMLDFLTIDLDREDAPFGSLSNLVSISAPVAFTNEFAPNDASGSAIPLYVSETLSYDERLSPVDFAAAFSVRSAAAAAGTETAPLIGQSYRRDLELLVVREVTASGMTIRVAHDWNSETRYSLLFNVPASLVSTNSHAYGGSVTNLYPNGSSHDSETRWHEIVLEEDFDGADERTTGIWLREEDSRDITELVVRTNSASIPFAKARDSTTGVKEESLSPAIWDSIQAVVITPLCFSTNENERLDLMVWDPDDDPPGPPVCADIYLELLAPAHRRRAEKLAAGETRDRYIQNHVIRLSRRAPIGTARRELP